MRALTCTGQVKLAPLGADTARVGGRILITALTTTLVAAICLGALDLAASAATSSNVVSATVASATNVDASGCATGTAGVTSFGTLLPATANVTSADCSIVFGSSNDTSMLDLSQQDQANAAMLMQPPSANVVGWWHLDGSWADSSPTNDPITPLGSPSFVTGVPGYGSAIHVDATHTALIAANSAYDLSELTVGAWFRVPSLSATCFCPILQENQNAPYRRNFGIQLLGTSEGGRVSASISINGGTGKEVHSATIAPYIDGNWHYVAMTASQSAGTIALYIDGSQVASSTFVGTIDQPGLSIGVGSYTTGDYKTVGDIDDPMILNVAEPAAAIKGFYTQAAPDYLQGTNDFSTPSAGFFGACLSSVSGGASADWTAAAGCPATDGPTWDAIAQTDAGATAKVAESTSPGNTTGQANLRFGFRTTSAQLPGSYDAPLQFDVLAPDL